MTSAIHKSVYLEDGRKIPAMHATPNDPAGTVATITYWDNDKGTVVVAQEVDGEYASFLAQASTLYCILAEMAVRYHSEHKHEATNFRECEFVSCTRATGALIGADRINPLN